jgi:hypothetical protein
MVLDVIYGVALLGNDAVIIHLRDEISGSQFTSTLYEDFLVDESHPNACECTGVRRTSLCPYWRHPELILLTLALIFCEKDYMHSRLALFY